MKEKILTFIIGVLVGAIIATGGYYLYSKNNNSKHGGMPDGERPAMMGQDGNNANGNMGTPPEKPSDDDGSGPKGEPGQKENTENTQNNNTNTNSSENNV